MRTVLTLEDVHYTFAGWPPVVRGVSLQVRAGDITCLLGRSGCGKTTVLRLAAGLLKPQSGAVRLQGQPMAPDPTRVGLVFQSPTLLDWLDVLDNVLLPVSLQGRVQASHRAAARDLLARLGLAAHAHHRPWQLSGGQQSRVAIARAWLLQPALLLMDEPFAALDAITREELQHEVLRMSREHHTAVLFVTHDLAEAVTLGENVLLMHQGQVVRQQGADDPDARWDPGWRYSAAFGVQAAQWRAALDHTARDEAAGPGGVS